MRIILLIGLALILHNYLIFEKNAGTKMLFFVVGMIQLHFLAEFLQRRITVNTNAPTAVIPALEEYGLGNPGPDIHLLRVPSVLEPEEAVARYSHIVPLVQTKLPEELSICGMLEHKYCAADWNTAATLQCTVCGQHYHPFCVGVAKREGFKCGCTRTKFTVKE